MYDRAGTCRCYLYSGSSLYHTIARDGECEVLLVKMLDMPLAFQPNLISKIKVRAER